MSAILNAPETTPGSWELLMGNPSGYRHRFGGVPVHSGIIPGGCQTPVHLLCTLDLADPRISLPIRHVSLLPLFFGFQYLVKRVFSLRGMDLRGPSAYLSSDLTPSFTMAWLL